MRTFVLGVGAQRAGTTWLHRYLAQSDRWAATPMKEFHVWDTIYRAPGEPDVVFEGERSSARHDLHGRMVRSPELYFDYFADLLDRNGGGITADVTPSYTGLTPDAFRRIRAGFAARAINVRVLFLMRDPVERCLSALRMYARKNIPVPGVAELADEEAALLAYAITPHAMRRGRYDRTVAALESAFARDELYFGLYETLFEPSSVEEISASVGIDPNLDFTTQRFNDSGSAPPLAPETRRAVADAYADTFAFCRDRFPATRSLWSHP